MLNITFLNTASKLYELGRLIEKLNQSVSQPVKPDDHSEVVPLLPIPNRKVKCLSADDSAGSRVKVGHRQAINHKRPALMAGRFVLSFQM